MTVLIDTNILLSAALYPDRLPFQAFIKAVTSPYRGIVCDQNIEELRRVFNRKFPHRISALEQFLSMALQTMDIVPVPEEQSAEEATVRDVYDRPILRAAIHAGADILLTGDKDFLAADLIHPRVMTPAEFMTYIHKT